MPEEKNSVGARIVEARLAGEYGEQGTATRNQYEEIQRRIKAMPTDKLIAELEEVRAALAAIHPASDVAEVERLLSRDAALERVIATAAPQMEEFEQQLDSIRRTVAHAQAAKATKQMDARRQVAQVDSIS